MQSPVSAVREHLPDGLWYVQRGDDVRGPFRWDVITRNIALGRIHHDDRLSQDASTWRPLDEIARTRVLPSMPPISIADERRRERRSARADDAPPAGLRRGDDRRQPEASSVVARRARSERVWASLRVPAMQARLPMLVVSLLLAVSVAVALRWHLPSAPSAPDCLAPPAPAVNWDFCAKPDVVHRQVNLSGASARNARLTNAVLVGANLQGADLAYADLSAADLTLVDAGRARLVGASLRKARLNHARLTGADLSFADLAGADLAGAELTATRLGHAIWSDGRVCSRDSIGVCNAQ